jgi:signal transduction histidine kinase
MLTGLRVLWTMSLAAFAALLVVTWTRGIDSAQEEGYARDIRRVQSTEARLNELVMRSRSGLINQWDPIVDAVNELARVHERLARPPGFLAPEGRAELEAQVRDSASGFQSKADHIESFKTETSVLRNSILYFPGAATALANHVASESSHDEAADGTGHLAPSRPGGEAVALRIKELLGEVLLYAMSADGGARRAHVEGAEEALVEAVHDWPHATDHSAVENLRRHVHVIITRKPLVDASMQLILAEPAHGTEIEATYSRYHRSAIEAIAAKHDALFLLALSTIAFAASEVLARQRRSAAALRDVSEALQTANVALRRERAREKELSELKSRFVSMTSHEFRTPLSVIRSSAELLEAYWGRWTEQKRGDHLRRIQSSVAIMARLLDGILVIGKSEAMALEFEPRPLDLPGFCADVIETMQQSSPGVPIAYSLRGEARRARVDERLLRHILTNLISNAIKYSRQGGSVDVEIDATDTDATFLVRDQGIGIPEGDRSQLFESFHRGSNVGAVPGTGLGLAMVKRSVDRHGGRIEMSSEVGVGTTFVVTIPLKGTDEEGTDRRG